MIITIVNIIVIGSIAVVFLLLNLRGYLFKKFFTSDITFSFKFVMVKEMHYY